MKTPEEMSDDIVDGCCLVPNKEAITEDSMLLSCHEGSSKCACSLKREIIQAIELERSRAKKLVEALEFYVDQEDNGFIAEQALAEYGAS